MNKGLRGLLSTVGGLSVGGIIVGNDLFPQKVHQLLNQVSDTVFSLLGPLQPSSDDIIFLTSSAVSGVLIWLALPKKSPPADDTIL